MAVTTPGGAAPGRWLLLIHQLPPKPDYFRVKIWRRLQRIGAVAIKNAVYVLPSSAEASEDFQWLRQEIIAGGGTASVCQAAFVDGLSDQQIESLFRSAREADYAALLAEAEKGGNAAALERRLHEITAIDHFGAEGRAAAERAVARLRPAASPAKREKPVATHLWITRPGVHVDRIASAWLIRRFIDADARITFAVEQAEAPAEGNRFDMFGGEYTHEGDRCTFETLLKRFGLTDDPALQAIAEMVHDVDCKDGKFGREETPGFERLIAGIVRRNAGDTERLERGAALLDDLYESLRGPGAGERRARTPRAPKQRRRSH
ncbi:MAG TPA: chromate resistance protein ChrB domain-containing protein [Burkholderiales bacterium]|nr:chromate resistance protein ChrB domain-containing protein [Burkholderiales bacterium]